MDKKKSQLFNFSHEVIPAMFHSQTNEFMKYLERDGTNFLKFWWDHVGSQLPVEKHSSFEGMDFKITPLDDKKKMTLITLPKPRDDGDVYFMGLISQPEKRFAWVKLPTQRALALLYRTDPKFPRGTELGDLTPRGLFVSLGAGPEPDADKFTAIVLRLSNPQAS
jgi:hypothetical protein